MSQGLYMEHKSHAVILLAMIICLPGENSNNTNQWEAKREMESAQVVVVVVRDWVAGLSGDQVVS